MEPSTLATVVVDDEQLARDELCFLLGQIDGVEVVARRPTESRRCASSKNRARTW